MLTAAQPMLNKLHILPLVAHIDMMIVYSQHFRFYIIYLFFFLLLRHLSRSLLAAQSLRLLLTNVSGANYHA